MNPGWRRSGVLLASAAFAVGCTQDYAGFRVAHRDGGAGVGAGGGSGPSSTSGPGAGGGGNGGANAGGADAGPPPCVLDVDTRRRTTCALLSDHTVWCFGQNEYGALGDGTIDDQPTPVRAGTLSDAVRVSVASRFAYAITGDGHVWAWGRNDKGQLGDGTRDNHLTPTEVPGLDGIVSIAGGRGHVCALNTAGILYCWGWNFHGQVGNDAYDVDQLEPAQIMPSIKAFAVGGQHTCALDTNGSVWCWGWNADGELGPGATIGIDVAGPLQVSLPFAAEQVVTHSATTCARSAAGEVWCWGDGNYGVLGAGEADTSTPKQLPGVTTSRLVAAGRRMCAFSDPSWICWGEHLWGNPQTPPTSVDPPGPDPFLSGSTLFAGSSYHFCARRPDGKLACWGDNSTGQLGIGSYDPQQMPALAKLPCPAL